MANEKLYAVRDTESGKLVSDITNPSRKYWNRRGNAESAIRSYNSRRVKFRHGKLELVIYELTEVKDDG